MTPELSASSAGFDPKVGLDPRSCEELFCAVIGLAIRDLEQIESLQDKPNLTVYERKKLLQLTEEWHPAAFLEGDWFEQICMMLNLIPGTIRKGLRSRRIVGSEG